MPQFIVRPASPTDAAAMAELFAAVAEERTGIASEPPVDVDERTVRFAAERSDRLRRIRELLDGAS